MSIHIIIDGYNLIRQSTTLSRLDHQEIMLGRDALVDMLAAYRKIKPHRITVVFDGHHSPAFSQQRDQKKGIAIRFYLPVGRQHVHQGISAQHDILLIQPAQGCRLADKIISIYDDMNGHPLGQCFEIC